MKAKITMIFGKAVPTKPGRYCAYFPNLDHYDIVNLVEQPSILNPNETYLMAVGPGGNIHKWNCVWSNELPAFDTAYIT